MHDTQRPGLAVALMLAAMLAFAAMDGLSKTLANDLAIAQILWVRYIFYILFAAAMLRRPGMTAVLKQTRQPWLQAGRALLIILENAVFVLAFTMMPLADMHAIAAASPLIVVALSVPMLGEQVGIRRWTAVLVGFLGVLVIVRPGFQTLDWRFVIAVTGTAMWALYQILVRMCARTDSSNTTWAWTAAIGLVATSVVGPFTWTWPDPHGWLLLAGIAVLGTLGHLALIKALCRGGRAAALQLHAAGLGRGRRLPHVRRRARHLDGRGRCHRHRQRPLCLAPRAGPRYTRPIATLRWPRALLRAIPAPHERRRRTLIDRLKTAPAAAVLAMAVSIGAAIGGMPPAQAQSAKGHTVTTPSGLKITDTQEGTGPSPKTGQTCVMHYTGWLYENGVKGRKFDSSVDRGQPFEFPIGTGRVIKGWDEGVASMKVGGKRTLIIPPELGYGARGAGGVIPPNATLVFDVELLGLR
jgi:peptidylprolyl isomerase